MSRLQGKRVIVTAGTQGLGFVVAERFLTEGAMVLATDLNSIWWRSVLTRLLNDSRAGLLDTAGRSRVKMT